MVTIVDALLRYKRNGRAAMPVEASFNGAGGRVCFVGHCVDVI